MATFVQRFVVYGDQAFKVRVGIAAVRVAIAVGSESVGTPEWTRKRAALSRLVLSDPVGVTDRFALILASQDVPVDEPDDALENKVRDVWDAIAGVTAEDLGPS